MSYLHIWNKTHPYLLTTEDQIQRFCAYRERCLHEVEMKLKEWKVPSGKSKKIIQQLIAEGFVNEERFSRSFVRGKFLNNHWGRTKISYELRFRGIHDSLISLALNELNEADYFTGLKNLIEKKRKEIKPGKNFIIREKLINFALGKGFEFELISKALNEMKI